MKKLVLIFILIGNSVSFSQEKLQSSFDYSKLESPTVSFNDTEQMVRACNDLRQTCEDAYSNPDVSNKPVKQHLACNRTCIIVGKELTLRQRDLIVSRTMVDMYYTRRVPLYNKTDFMKDKMCIVVSEKGAEFGNVNCGGFPTIEEPIDVEIAITTGEAGKAW